MRRMKKILFVINTMGQAGAEKALLEVLRRIPKKEYETHLYVLTGQGELVRELPKEVKLVNHSYCELPVLSREGRRHLIKTSVSALFHGHLVRRIPYLTENLLDMIKKRSISVDKLMWRLLADAGEQLTTKYDLAVAFLEGGAAYYVADCVNAAKKAAFIHIDYQKSGYSRRLDGESYSCFDKIFMVSGEVKDSFLSVYPQLTKKAQVFHNILDRERIQRLSREPGGFDDKFDGVRILTVGRLVEQKAYDIAVEAMKLLRKDGYPVRWYVLGDGELRKNLERQIARLGLANDFLLLGGRENPFPYYLQTDLYVHATRFEGKSIAVQEAKILGCPVIVSDCPGNREQVEPGVNGLVCELNPKDIRDKIVLLIENKELCKALGRQAAEEETGDGDIMTLLKMADDT